MKIMPPCESHKPSRRWLGLVAGNEDDLEAFFTLHNDSREHNLMKIGVGPK
jgi:hypothetical protein